MMVGACCGEGVLMNVGEEWYTDGVYTPLRNTWKMRCNDGCRLCGERAP